MRRLVNDNRIREISDLYQAKGLDLLDNRINVGSLSEVDEYSSDEIERFWSNSRNIQESIITECEPFPGEMLNFTSRGILNKSMLSLMVGYYTAAYESKNFKGPFDEGPEDSIILRVAIDKFSQYKIGSEVFRSTMSSWHTKNSFVLSNFVTIDNRIDCYPGQVQYFFKHIIDFEDRPAEYYLVYIW